ncbi:hypothetical protein KUW17_09820 [Leisingera aquaemixtae]|uniref:hypothetical protein n=1 Tax=Leisingera TaxID=191028 RepID=UPI001C94232C|nr:MULTISPECIES: hypothetical protein [Leisingera]MBY6067036.1 hypothetical protein [Leisingera aquaemixtae]MCB4455134.1 hypothetical protein [Leisingera sp. McT4-56]
MQKTVSVLKDLVVLLRDMSVIALFAVFLLFPQKLNAILVSAGFEEGSFAGFKWKSKLVEYDATVAELQTALAEAQKVNARLTQALQAAEGGTGELQRDAELVQQDAAAALEAASKTVAGNQQLVEQARAQLQEEAVRYCYQEDSGQKGPQQYLTACHTTPERCERAKVNPATRSSACAPLDMNTAPWQPSPGGFWGSLFQYSAAPLPAPFPQVE